MEDGLPELQVWGGRERICDGGDRGEVVNTVASLAVHSAGARGWEGCPRTGGGEIRGSLARGDGVLYDWGEHLFGLWGTVFSCLM